VFSRVLGALGGKKGLQPAGVPQAGQHFQRSSNRTPQAHFLRSREPQAGQAMKSRRMGALQPGQAGASSATSASRGRTSSREVAPAATLRQAS